jgi:hypothetical protein
LKFFTSYVTKVFTLENINLTILELKSLEEGLNTDAIAALQKCDKNFKSGWLYDVVIDAFILRLCQHHSNVLSVECVVVTALENLKSIPNIFEGVSLKDKTLIFFPHNIWLRHWTLIVVDIQAQELIYFNPIGYKPEKKEISLFSDILVLIQETFKIDTTSWLCKIIPHVLQSDSYSCGVFVCWYAQQIVRGESLLEHFNTLNFRSTIYKTIVEN